MSWMRALAVAGFLLMGVVSACVSVPDQRGVAGQPGQPYSCYWLSDEGEGWVLRREIFSERQCFVMDSCSGGMDGSSGGCYKWALAPDAPARPWLMTRALLEQRSTAHPYRCYWLTNQGEGWFPYNEYSERQCFNMDSCSGGLGQSGGGCYKWAASPEAEGKPWDRARLYAEAPPMQRGIHVIGAGACPLERCYYGNWHAGVDTPIYERAGSLHRVGTIVAGEWVSMVDTELRIAPLRGVVLADDDNEEGQAVFAQGDVVYLLGEDPNEQGYFALWRRGETFLVYQPASDARFRWDVDPARWAERNAARTGRWTRLERSDGSTGWVRNLPETS